MHDRCCPCGENRVRVTCMWPCGMAVGVTDRSLNDIKDLHPFCGYAFLLIFFCWEELSGPIMLHRWTTSGTRPNHHN